MTSKSWQLYLQMVGKQTRRWDKESSFIQLGTADLDGQSKRYRPGTETFSEEKLISISARPKFDESVELHDLCCETSCQLGMSFLLPICAHVKIRFMFYGFSLACCPLSAGFFFFKCYVLKDIGVISGVLVSILHHQRFWEHGIYWMPRAFPSLWKDLWLTQL